MNANEKLLYIAAVLEKRQQQLKAGEVFGQMSQYRFCRSLELIALAPPSLIKEARTALENDLGVPIPQEELP